MGVFAKGEGVVGAGEGGLEVAQEGIHGTERRVLRGGLAAKTGGDVVAMGGAGGDDPAEARQSVGDHLGGGRQGALGPGFDRRPGEGDRVVAHQDRLAVRRGLHRGDEGHLVLRATARLAAGALATQVGVVNLYPSFKAARGLALLHHLHQLLLDQPGRLVAHAQVPRQFQGRHGVLGLRQQMHGEIPHCQRQLGRLEHRSGRHRGLTATGGTLPVRPTVMHETTVRLLAAARTDETLRPARRYQRLVALRFRSVRLEKLRHRQSFLELDPVDSHDASPQNIAMHHTLRLPLAHHVSLAEAEG